MLEEKLYKEDRRENIKMFQGMEKQYSFSKYSGELNQIFGDKSFNNFYNELHSGKKRTRDINLYNENPSSSYIHNIQSGSFDLVNYKHFLRLLQKESELEEKRRKEYKEKLKLVKVKDDEEKYDKKKINLKKKTSLPQVPSIGWYHPNYNSIRKNEPRIFIGSGYIPNKKLEERKTINSPKKEENIINKSINSNNSSNNNSKIIKNINRRNKNLSVNKSKSNLKLDDYNNQYNKRKNNALRFSQYSWRKPLITENITSNIISNTEVNNISHEKIKGLFEFNKMNSNLEIGSFLNKKSIIPPLGFYQPNYDYVQTKSPQIYLSRKNPVITKHMKLKKLLYEYNVPKEYELITNLNVN